MTLLSARDLAVATPGSGEPPPGLPGDVLSNFSLDVESGEWLALTGANGCGKTSLLMVLAGLWQARRGTLHLAGEPFGPGAGRHLRSRVGVILQDPSSQLLQPTVREELTFSALNIGLSEAEVTHGLERWTVRLGLQAELERDPQHLSAGRQQLVLLAAALISQPIVLIADEPAAHLDAGMRETVLAAIREEVNRGMAAIWVTQDRGERSAADRVVALTPEESAERVGDERLASAQHEVMMRLEVSSMTAEDGPCVRTPTPFEIGVASHGITALEGANGTGKSVLLSVAAGALETEQVRVEWTSPPGTPPILSSQYPEQEIFEERVADEVAYAALSRGMKRPAALEAARHCFESLGLGGGFSRRRTWELSGGEKRLVTAVSALVAPASLRILDEPTAGLDATRRRALARLVGVSAREVPVLVASQDTEWLGWVGARTWRVPGGRRDACAKSQQKNGLTEACGPA